MHSDELWQLYDANGEPISGAGWSAARDNPHGEDTENVGVAIVFLYRQSDRGLEFLWQRRSLEIDHHPGDWDASVGGHINLGESATAAAVREAKEELGAELETNDLQFVVGWSFNKNKFAWLYLVDYTGKPDEFHFDDHEVMEVKWVPYAEMEDFRHQFAKKPIRKNKVMFRVIDEWLKMRGLVAAKE